ncbi:MAG: 23S rRNA (adenine(1618)-N(6))-methyltransferase RlmF [Bacteroidota bacterium]
MRSDIPHNDAVQKDGLHPRNKNKGRYDFPSLIASHPELEPFLFINKHRKETIDFSDPEAVRTLNSVILKHHYGLNYWEIPKEYLCPPIPGRADYIHYAADLLSSGNNGNIPTENSVSVLDIGVGSSCIYPLIGFKEYGWCFTGADIDPVSLDSARKIAAKNNIPSSTIDIRAQTDPNRIFAGIIRPTELFDLTICNPPFHSTMEQAVSGTKRKWKNLGIPKERASVLNFGGQQNELLFPGGEEQFIKNMISESVAFAKNVLWFTTLISKQSLLPLITSELRSLNAREIRIISMAQGQKKSRFAAWTFQLPEEQRQWTERRWK